MLEIFVIAFSIRAVSASLHVLMAEKKLKLLFNRAHVYNHQEVAARYVPVMHRGREYGKPCPAAWREW